MHLEQRMTQHRVITFQAPRGDRIDVTPRQEEMFRRAGVWPRNNIGEEYCSVYHGLHRGEPTWTDEQVREMASTRIGGRGMEEPKK